MEPKFDQWRGYVVIALARLLGLDPDDRAHVAFIVAWLDTQEWVKDVKTAMERKE